jgi:hypothetical protein
MTLDCYRVKPQFLMAGLHSYILYVRPRELSMYAAPEHYDLIGRTMHANRHQSDAVRRLGYCERKLTVGHAAKASVLYSGA